MSFSAKIIVNACARRLGSRTSHGQERRKGFQGRLGGSQEVQAVPGGFQGGVLGGWGGESEKFALGGRVGLGGRRLYPGLLDPDAFRQEVETNILNIYAGPSLNIVDRSLQEVFTV